MRLIAIAFCLGLSCAMMGCGGAESSTPNELTDDEVRQIEQAAAEATAEEKAHAEEEISK